MSAPGSSVGLSLPERILWARLRQRVEGRPTLRRQHPVGPYVLDFYCAASRLRIEVDGASHSMGNRPARDSRRDAWLQARGIEVVRISAQWVLEDPESVVEWIVRRAQDHGSLET